MRETYLVEKEKKIYSKRIYKAANENLNNKFDYIEVECDDIQTVESAVTDKEGNVSVIRNNYVVCAVCGHANKMPLSQCEICSSIFEFNKSK